MSHMLEEYFKAMACDWSIKCYPQSNLSKEDSRSLIKNAISKIREFEDYFTIFKSSPFNMINQNAGIRETQVSPQCIQVVKKACEYSKETDNFFNILYRSHELYRDLDLIEINETKSTIYLPHKDMKLSLGGIGKGLAVDLAFEFLKAEGLINFLVNGSGDIRVHSHQNAPREWRIGIKNPFNIRNNIGHIKLTNHSIATSGEYLKGKHITSSHKNRPISVTVMGNKAVDCDVWATYLSTLSIDESLKKANQSDVYSILVSRNGKVYHTKKSYKSLSMATL